MPPARPPSTPPPPPQSPPSPSPPPSSSSPPPPLPLCRERKGTAHSSLRATMLASSSSISVWAWACGRRDGCWLMPTRGPGVCAPATVICLGEHDQQTATTTVLPTTAMTKRARTTPSARQPSETSTRLAWLLMVGAATEPSSTEPDKWWRGAYRRRCGRSWACPKMYTPYWKS